MATKPTVFWSERKLFVVKDGCYRDGSPVIRLRDRDKGGDFAIASVCIPNSGLSEGETCIKDYSENEGVFQALLDANLVEDTGKRVYSGWIQAPVVKLLF